MHKQTRSVLLFALFIAAIVLMRYSPLGDAITFENLKKNRQYLLAFVHERYLLSVVLFILIDLLLVALSMPGAVILTITGGYLFGTIAGVLYVNIAATTGAVLAFLSARYLLGNRLQDRYYLLLKKFNDELAKNGTQYLITLRLIPVFPFFLINFLSGLTKIPLKTFFWTTSLGIIPSSAVFAFAGRQVGSINSPREILSKNVVVALVVLALFTLFPVLFQRIQRGRRKGNG